MTVQLKDWACCQACGLTVHRSQATPEDGWLVSPHRRYGAKYGIDIVRCPRHISEWALRESVAGRTKFWRQKMEEGKKLPPPAVPPELSPMPMFDADDLPSGGERERPMRWMDV